MATDRVKGYLDIKGQGTFFNIESQFKHKHKTTKEPKSQGGIIGPLFVELLTQTEKPLSIDIGQSRPK